MGGVGWWVGLVGWGGVVGGVGWYLVLGTKYLILIMIISPFLISPFDRVQTTLFEDFIFLRHRIGSKKITAILTFHFASSGGGPGSW